MSLGIRSKGLVKRSELAFYVFEHCITPVRNIPLKLALSCAISDRSRSMAASGGVKTLILLFQFEWGDRRIAATY
jgi:hypothetical protein